MTLLVLATLFSAAAWSQESVYSGNTTCATRDGSVRLERHSKQGGNAPTPGQVMGTALLSFTTPPTTYRGTSLEGGGGAPLPVAIEVLHATKTVPPSPGPFGLATWTQTVRLSKIDDTELIPGVSTLKISWRCSASMAPPIPMAPPTERLSPPREP